MEKRQVNTGTMREIIEKQLEFARQKVAESKYMEMLRWEGYCQGLLFVLGNLKENSSSEAIKKGEL